MFRTLAVASFLLLLGAPAWATSLSIYESTLGASGVTAEFPNGSSLVADLDYDADSAENGGLLFGGPSEITFLPFGDVVFSNFICQAVDCFFSFNAGGEGVGSLSVSGGDGSAETGIKNLGVLEFDIPVGFGTIELTGCNYTDGNANELTCDPFTVVQVVPEPGTVLLVGLGTSLMALYRRRRLA